MITLKKAAAGFAVAATAAAGVTIASAGAASAAEPVPHVYGNTVAVDVNAPLPGQTCIGMLVPPHAAAELAGAAIAGDGDLMTIIQALGNRSDVISLKGPGAFGFHLPATIPGQPGKLWADNVPSNVYALAVICMGHNGPMEPHVFPAVVGDPLAAFSGSAAGSVGGGAPAPAPTTGGGNGSASGSSS